MVLHHPGSSALYSAGNADDGSQDPQLAVLVLNQAIPHAHTLFPHVWRRATHRLCIDGGANHLHAHSPHEALERPTAIVGDLDSLTAPVRAHYERQGTVVHRYADQDSTDFMKGLRYLDEHLAAGGSRGTTPCTVVVFGGLSGRLDHVMHTLKVLLNEHTERKRRILVVSEDNLTFVLPEGESRVCVTEGRDGPTCGLLPLAGEVILSTEGLRWNLSEQVSSFTGLMSTSNLVEAAEVVVRASAPVVWTCEFHPETQ
ncbi:thiamine pyrophosphokinase [Coemansia erecta]|uniref:Thiamine pyrophosphokinase n=1 Tax=Coemansia erecta TaxID=147472 RepID=A0A9W7XYS1_9FUNG|nr:thiamine pyrophosphokinase [Coemansia erecta]